MPSHSQLPLEARQAAWDALWRRLLAPVSDDDDPEPAESEEHEEDDQAA
jgi:hypothetical protein